MPALLHQLLSGLANGAIYASVALALVMIFKATHHVNFAQGELAMFSTYVALTLINAGMPYWVAFALTVVFSFIAGVGIERLVMRRLRNMPVLSAVIVFIGLLVFLNGVAGWEFTYTIKAFPSPFDAHAWYGSTYLSPHEVGMMAVTLFVLGIRVGSMLALGWGLASALGAVAGMMAAPIIFLEPNMMGGVILYGFAAALLGGIDNPWGAPIGGFIVGVLENLAGAYVVGTHLKMTLALFVIVAVLVFKPSGLFGRTVVVRV
jgi:branched-chain amino acid transport system permease protein